MYNTIVIIFIAGTIAYILLSFDMLRDSNKHTFVFAEWVLAIIIFATSGATMFTYDNEVAKIQENSIMEFVDGTVSYDTLSMDKNDKILTIKLIKKK